MNNSAFVWQTACLTNVNFTTFRTVKGRRNKGYKLVLPFLFVFGDRILLCAPGWLQTLCSPASVFQVLALLAHTTMPNLVSFQRGNLSSFVFFFCWLRV
jgi:hypothetical protein